MVISVGNKIELVHLDDIINNSKSRTVYVSKIFDILPGNTLQIAMPVLSGRLVPLSIDEKYSACFYTNNGLMQANVIVTSRYKKNNIFFLEVMLITDLTKVQRREFYRYNCLIDSKIRVVSDHEYDTGELDDGVTSEDILSWQNAKILDISGGGARIMQKVHLAKNEIVKVNFYVEILNDVIKFGLFARILESKSLQGRNDMFEQRLEFLKISQEERDKIIRFIFESERMNRAKKVGLK